MVGQRAFKKGARQLFGLAKSGLRVTKQKRLQSRRDGTLWGSVKRAYGKYRGAFAAAGKRLYRKKR